MRYTIILALVLIGSQLRAQTPDSVQQESKGKTFARNFAAPIALLGLGTYSAAGGKLIDRYKVREWRNNNFAGFRTHVDNHLQYGQIWIVYGLDLVGVKAKNDFLNRSLLLAKSEILMTVFVRTLKPTMGVLRPDGSNHQSFPSGHTAQAFVAATFMHKEYGGKSIWYSIGAYTLATSVGALRILNNKHWISDVLAGAGFGILSTEIVYATHRYRWGKRPSLTVLPTYSNGPGLYMALRVGDK